MLSAMSLLSVHLIGQGILSTKLSNRFQAELDAEVAADHQLLLLERDFKKDPLSHLDKKVSFIADDLAFGYDEGVDIFKITKPPLQSMLAIRTADEHILNWTGNCYCDVLNCHAWRSKEQEEREGKGMVSVRVRAPQSKAFENLLNYQQFQLKYQKRPVRVFGLFNDITHQKAVLREVSDNPNARFTSYQLPFALETGSLFVTDIYFEHDWHTVLILTVKARGRERGSILIFDISDPKQSLTPWLYKEWEGGCILKGGGVIVRDKVKGFGIAWVGSLYDHGILQILWFDDPKQFFQLKVGAKSLTFVSAIDSNKEGWTNRIYAADDHTLWRFETKTRCVKKLTDIELISAMRIVPDPKQRADQIYFLGKGMMGKGLYMVRDLSSMDNFISIPQLIKGGDFTNLFIRSGSIILIPAKNTLQDPNDRVLLEAVVWDPKHEQEVYFTLNSSCQLKSLVIRNNNGKYARLLWRKLSSRLRD